MDSFDKTCLDIDELAKKIEARIKELEEEEAKKSKKVDDEYNIDDILAEIDKKIAELEKAETMEIDLDSLTDKINRKLEKEYETPAADSLSEISKAINDMIKALEAKKKKKKKAKAKYCDLARKNANKTKKKNTKKNDKK